ncbi:MAG: DUF1292 domain-containing protein [Bacillota bacterium]
MDQEENVLTLTDDEGNEHAFTVIDIIEVNDTEYAILFPHEEAGEDDEEKEAIILKITADEEGNEVLVSIEDDDEWEEVADAWAHMAEED